jgi:hypothetical protein
MACPEECAAEGAFREGVQQVFFGEPKIKNCCQTINKQNTDLLSLIKVCDNADLML